MKGPAGLTTERVVSTLLAGLIAGLVALISCVSFAALIFSGKLSGHIGSGISITIATAIIAGLIISLLSAARPLVAIPDDDTAPILALMVTLVIATLPKDTPVEVLFVTAFGALACATLLTGAVLAALGIFRLGTLVRYLPYSVMGGYFAGAGLLLIQGALRVATDLPLDSLESSLSMLDPDNLWRWLPAVLAAALIRIATHKWHESYAMPLSIGLLIAAFFLVSAALGNSPSVMMEQGWLIGPFPESAPQLWNPVLLERSAEIEWSAILANMSGLGTIVMLSAISLMLTASGLSLLQRDNIDINKELTIAGLANAVSGLGGGLVALPSMTLSNLAMTVGAPKSRFVGVVVAAFCAFALFFAMGAIAWFPKPVVAGLLIFLGSAFLERWLIESRTQLPALEYLVVVVILLVVAVAGFLPGVFFGLICAILLFVVNYSRINVVRYALTGAERKSNVERNVNEEQYLLANGQQTLILKLQGYLFFGTAAALGAKIDGRIADQKQPRLGYVAIDFVEVSGMDSSAALSFMKLAQEAAKSNFFLLLTGLSEDMKNRLMSSWFESESSSYVQVFTDLDRGVEWIEERMLSDSSLESEHEGIIAQLAEFLPAPEDWAVLKSYFEQRKVSTGDVLAHQGASSDEMFLLESCTASVFLITGSDKMHRIRRAGTGTVFGEVGFYLGSPRTASVIVDNGGDVFVLNQEANRRLESEHPRIAAAVHKFMIRVITQRLLRTTTTLQAVLT